MPSEDVGRVPGRSPVIVDELNDLSRAELNELAESLGLERPARWTDGGVRALIREAKAEAGKRSA
jgi:hypothetical protein